MKTIRLLTLGAWLGSSLIAAANDTPPNPEQPKRQPPPELLKKFDKDGDGKLSDQEGMAIRQAMKGKMEERRKEMLQKYDKDGDGKLNEEERAAMPKPPRRPDGPAKGGDAPASVE